MRIKIWGGRYKDEDKEEDKDNYEEKGEDAGLLGTPVSGLLTHWSAGKAGMQVISQFSSNPKATSRVSLSWFWALGCFVYISNRCTCKTRLVVTSAWMLNQRLFNQPKVIQPFLRWMSMVKTTQSLVVSDGWASRQVLQKHGTLLVAVFHLTNATTHPKKERQNLHMPPCARMDAGPWSAFGHHLKLLWPFPLIGMSPPCKMTGRFVQVSFLVVRTATAAPLGS